MFKKLLAFLKFIVVFIVWTLVFVSVSRWFMLLIWKFDILYKQQWQAIGQYWNEDGTIAGASDYLFFIALFVLVLLWFFGFRYFYKLKYMRMMLFPFRYFNDRQIRKYEQEDTRAVIKNIRVGEKLTVEDVIKDRIKQEEVKQSPKVSQDLRQSISQKINQKKDK